jgi:hypothetical protein
MDEVFDVVDAKDQVLGQQPRSEVHRLGLMHPRDACPGIQRLTDTFSSRSDQ